MSRNQSAAAATNSRLRPGRGDKKLPYLIKNRVNDAILKGTISKTDMEASSSANAVVRKVFGTTMQPQASEKVVAALLLKELNTSPTMPRTFFGERILIQVTHQSERWRGRTLGGSQFCSKELPLGSDVAGSIVGGHFVIDARRSGATDVLVNVKEIPKNICFAIMTSPRADPGVLLSANAFCPNHGCINVCSLTFTQFQKAMAQLPSQRPDAQPHIVWECNMCDATMMVGEDTFNNLYKM